MDPSQYLPNKLQVCVTPGSSGSTTRSNAQATKKSVCEAAPQEGGCIFCVESFSVRRSFGLHFPELCVYKLIEIPRKHGVSADTTIHSTQFKSDWDGLGG